MLTFKELYQGYTKSHGVYTLKQSSTAKGKMEGSAMTLKGPPTDEEWEKHVRGEGRGLGIVPLMDDGKSVSFAAIDIDVYPLDHAALERDAAQLPLVMTKSKSGGAHLWLFLAEPTPAKLVIDKMREWASALGFPKAEIFPKQYMRVTQNDVGNWINLPYYGESRFCIYEGVEQDLESFINIANKRRVDEDQLRSIVIGKVDDASGMFADGPPCLQALHTGGISEGGRNTTAFNVAFYFKLKDADNWQDDIQVFNREQILPPLPINEINNIIQSHMRRDVNYQCSKEPLAGVCDKRKCKLRQYGVDAKKTLNLRFDGLTKINTKPPRYLLNVEGIRIELESAEILMSQNKLTVAIVEQANLVMEPLPAKKWLDVITNLVAEQEIVEVPVEASAEGQFYLYLRDYFDRRAVDDRDGVAQGNVWIHNGKAHFQPKEFLEYLRRQNFRDISSTKAWFLCQQISATSLKMRIKGGSSSVWVVPLSRIDDLQNEKFDVPKFDDAFGETPDEKTNNDPSV
jgi:hypothetical protein